MWYKKMFVILLCMLQSVTCILYAKTENENIAYKDGNVRFTVITDGVIRMEYTPDGKFVDDPSFIAVNRNYPEVDFKVKKKKGWLEINTEKMKMRYKLNSGKFTSDNLEVLSNDKNVSFVWKPGTQQKGNLKGTFRTLDGLNGDEQSQSWMADSKQNAKVNLEDGLLATDGWTLIDDSKGLLFDDDSEWSWVKERKNIEGQDWYFMAYGHNYKKALKDFTVFAGKMPLPPRFTFGYWWSRYWSYSDKEFRELVNNFHTYQIPLDVLVVDMDWHYTEQGKGGWTGWTWNRGLFPQPDKFLSYLKDNDLKITLNLHPADGVASYEEKYELMAKDMGIDPETKQTIPWVSSDKKFIKSMFKNILTPMENDGVDFWWLDWQQGLYDSKIKNLSNTWWLNYAFFSYMEKNTNKRPMLYHRWGGLGNHRYQIGFSGDAVVSWKSLDYQPYFNSTASNVLYGYWSHDLGGHIGDHIDPEMYIRWMQFGALSPVMRTHSQKNANMNKEPWGFNAEYCGILRETVRQRYEMAPYIYTMARKAYDEGLSLCRPMYYDYPEKQEAYDFRNEYMFGDNILVAPITAPAKDGYAAIKVWLPEGEWYELHTGALLTGNQIIERYFSIDEYPIYVKAGSILPMYSEEVMNLNRNDETLVLTVFPGGNGNSSFTFYEDNGNDKKYATEYALTKLNSLYNDSVQEIIIGKREGEYAEMPANRNFKLKIISVLPPVDITMNGKSLNYEYLGDEFALLVDIPSSSCNEEKVIKITYPSKDVNFNGLYGVAKKVAKSMEGLKYRDAYLAMKEHFAKMGSLGEAVTYNPEKIEELVSEFWNSFDRLPEILKEQGLNEDNSSWFLKQINWQNRKGK